MSQTEPKTSEMTEEVKEFINEFNAEQQNEKTWVGEDGVVQLSHKSVSDFDLPEQYEYGPATQSLIGNPGDYAYAFNSEGVTHFVDREYADRLCQCFGTMPTFEDVYIDTDYQHYPVVFDLGEYVGIVAPRA